MRRIIIDAEKCDGCKNCSLACMQAHRKDTGTLYDLNLLDPETLSIKTEPEATPPYSAATAISRNVSCPV